MGGFLPFLACTPSFFPTFPHLFPSLTLFAFAFALCVLCRYKRGKLCRTSVFWMALFTFIFTFFCFLVVHPSPPTLSTFFLTPLLVLCLVLGGVAEYLWTVRGGRVCV